MLCKFLGVETCSQISDSFLTVNNFVMRQWLSTKIASIITVEKRKINGWEMQNTEGESPEVMPIKFKYIVYVEFGLRF